jgi:hypothetical protein
VSGWERGYDCAAFGLTATKGAYWHRSCACPADSLDDLFRAHLEPLGFSRLRSPSPNLLVVTREDLTAGRPGDVVFSQGPIFEALQSVPTG